MTSSADRTGSYVVRRDGIDGQREHWMPGNFRRGTGPREKRGYDTEQEAREHLNGSGSVYQCPICDKWHRASEPKR